MANHITEVRSLQSLSSFQLPVRLKALFWIFIFMGFCTMAYALYAIPSRGWPNFLLNYFFFLTLGLSGAFFTALQHITNAYWSVTVRRLAEALMSYLPIAFILGIAIVLGRIHLYEWSVPSQVATDANLQLKAGYLNTTFFAIRLFLAIGLWIFLGMKMRKNSTDQDTVGDVKFTLANIKLSAIFIPIFAISFTLVSFDLIMSLEPHWFSTIFGVYCFSGLFYGGLSLLAVLIIYGWQQGVFSKQILNENHLHDVGQLMFAFTVFWGYIMFSQLMLQWYANLPEETPYYIRRFAGGWWNVAIVLFLIHFVIPFLLLLPREAKRNGNYLLKVALLMLCAHWLDVYFMVMPVFFKEGPVFGWIEIGTFVGFLGLFGISIGRFLEKTAVIPLKDPRLAECLAHSQ